MVIENRLVDPAEVEEDAASAAELSGTTVRTLHELADIQRVRDLYHQVWQPAEDRPLVTIEQLRAMTHAGNYLAGAFDGSEMVGACVGFFSAPPGTALHSHIAAVAPQSRGRSVGLALKLHQRMWALTRGLDEITWTFDPLVRRNAYFNLTKLGARPREYLIDFYGDIGDAINAGQGSDRLLVEWKLTRPLPDSARAQQTEVAAMRQAGAVTGLDAVEGVPRQGRHETWESAETVLVTTPADIEALRSADPELARQWRTSVRAVLGQLLHSNDHGHVTFTRDGWYVVRRGSR